MTDRAIIKGALVDARNVGTHKVVKLTVHVAEELAMQVFKAFGWPTMTDPIPVAVARLNNAVKPKAKRESLASDAGALCAAPSFHRFLLDNYKHIKCDLDVDAPEWAAQMVHQVCGVDSRKEFDTDSAAARRWLDLKAYYTGWRQL